MRSWNEESCGLCPAAECVSKAATEADLHAKPPEALVGLNQISQGAKKDFFANGVFPLGDTGLTPTTPCCAQPEHYCSTDLDAWANPIWQRLDFRPADGSRFQYEYWSDGKKFAAVAVGDLDCDGVAVTYSAKGSLEEGKPVVTFIEPPPGSH